MSHEIVKGLKLKKDVKEVWIKASSNNISPKTYHWEELKGLSAQYKHHGEREVVFFLLRMYWEGMFQPGTYNKFYKAVKIFEAKYPKLQYYSVGDVITEDICTGPIEDLPKYLNTQDRLVKDIVTRRLNGETIDPATIDRPVTMTREDFYDKVYDEYKNYRKRKKGKFIIKTGNMYVAGGVNRHRRYVTGDKRAARVFDSWEEATVCCARGYFSNNIKILKEN
jgi:hypothetical protein